VDHGDGTVGGVLAELLPSLEAHAYSSCPAAFPVVVQLVVPVHPAATVAMEANEGHARRRASDNHALATFKIESM